MITWYPYQYCVILRLCDCCLGPLTAGAGECGRNHLRWLQTCTHLRKLDLFLDTAEDFNQGRVRIQFSFAAVALRSPNGIGWRWRGSSV